MLKEEAKDMLGENVERKVPTSLVERRAFMKLPMEERQRILAEQADKMASLYESDTGWKDIEGGDLIE